MTPQLLKPLILLDSQYFFHDSNWFYYFLRLEKYSGLGDFLERFNKKVLQYNKKSLV